MSAYSRRIMILVDRSNLGRIALLNGPCVRAFAPRQSSSLFPCKSGMILLVSDILLALAFFLNHVSVLLFSTFFRLGCSILILVLHS